MPSTSSAYLMAGCIFFSSRLLGKAKAWSGDQLFSGPNAKKTAAYSTRTNIELWPTGKVHWQQTPGHWPGTGCESIAGSGALPPCGSQKRDWRLCLRGGMETKVTAVGRCYSALKSLNGTSIEPLTSMTRWLSPADKAGCTFSADMAIAP